MNGFPAGRAPYDYGDSNPLFSSSTPNDRTMADGYRPDGPSALKKGAPRLNLTASNQAQRITRVDLKDAIQVHLLTETALTDSKHFEILSQEEVDDLKKQSQLLAQRVQPTKKNLAIQSKYRDAAISMAKLYGPAQSDDPSAIDAEREKEACERQCEQLAAELFNLEKRLMAPQRRLLEHTAGILQLTHKASKKKTSPPLGQLINGIPGGPESMYTYSLGRNSLDQGPDDTYFDESNLVQLDSLDGQQAGRYLKKNVIEIPLKSPNRDQHQLRGEMDRLREESIHLRGQTDMVIKRLQSLNSSLRETIVRFNPDANRDYIEPPDPNLSEHAQPAELLKSQVEYLESGLVAVQTEQETLAGGREMGEHIEVINLQLRDLIMSSDPHYVPAPIPSESDVQGQLKYLEDSIRQFDTQLARATSKGLDAETGPVLARFWDSIQNEFHEASKRKEERRKARSEKGLPDDDDDVTDDEIFDTTEPYSLAAFASRVQWLHAQALTLKDQKYVLKRQVKQQRELNSRSDAEKDQEISRRQEKLEQSLQRLAKADSDATEAQTKLSKALEDLEAARNSAGAAAAVAAQVEGRDAKIQSLEARLKEAQDNLATAESDSSDAVEKMAAMDLRLSSLAQEKVAADEKIQSLGKELQSKGASLLDMEKALKVKESEMEQLNMTLAELKTEVTIARAELDGAYGSRAERAADVAALKNNAEVVKLQNQVERLKRELGETVQELESITKETIGAEREKVELEVKLDEALSAKATLNAEMQKSREKMTKLQEELDGERLKVASGQGQGGRPGAGASMLSEQFRATMREERKRYQEDLKEERTKCRKLEDELSRLKRGQGPGKLPLSPR